MAKTLVVAEKPSVARDLASTLPGSFKQSKDKTHLEGEDYTVTWAVGHLVGLAPPDEYDPKLKKWRFADLPILPEHFKLIPNDERAASSPNRSRSAGALNHRDSQNPPLRPLGPWPHTPPSRSRTLMSGSESSRCQAVHIPV